MHSSSLGKQCTDLLRTKSTEMLLRSQIQANTSVRRKFKLPVVDGVGSLLTVGSLVTRSLTGLLVPGAVAEGVIVVLDLSADITGVCINNRSSPRRRSNPNPSIFLVPDLQPSNLA